MNGSDHHSFVEDIVEKFGREILAEWNAQRDEYGGADFVSVINTQKGTLFVAPRPDFLASAPIGMMAAWPCLKTPAGHAPPAMPNSACMWLIVGTPGGTGICFRLIYTMLTRGGEA